VGRGVFLARVWSWVGFGGSLARRLLRWKVESWVD
jgi:hypothetical protein